ncbi:MAG: hypothetical protein QOK31_1658 [Solirubrobacteraceae bacterium]|jgi:hypothetical protein|nr:hypothetical protein [Solirubrobacteraceae bacterium]
MKVRFKRLLTSALLALAVAASIPSGASAATYPSCLIKGQVLVPATGWFALLDVNRDGLFCADWSKGKVNDDVLLTY